MRVGDLELNNWKEKYHALTAKHLKMLDYFNIQIDYDLDELEAEFDQGIIKLKTLQFIDSEEFLNQAIKDKKNNFSRRSTRFFVRYRFWNLSFCNII
jgi:adenylosuccinate synthase